ncbi:Putative secreted glycosyl hydrolase [Mariniradius saccharolyticus AK6]|uniref:Secreted glycosyl hydrolase n=1 Tax=Mariniradius saccharolyticus AK6 TaxID=1239962 RepID=M7X7Q4_9BACT|nr:Putative secreted glycosyl hydrolase [Mariniradius saccharolyticus AK6]
MKNRVIVMFGILAVALAMSFQGKKEITLFNGKNLKGWKIYGTEKWYVQDGLLISESGPDKGYGYLGTEKDYKDFELTLEFKQEADGNSGVFIRSTVDGTKVSGWQVEVAPPSHSTGGIYESYGRGWLIKPDSEKDKALKYGDWNEMKIIVKGDRVVSYLNGLEMVDFSDEKIGKGEGGILLQIHDGGGIKVYWRNIRLKPL